MWVLFDHGSRFCEWARKLFGWLVLVGVLMQLDGGNFIWSSPAGTAFLALIAFLLFSAVNCGVRFVYGMDRTRDPNIRHFILRPVEACLDGVYIARQRFWLLTGMFATAIAVPELIAMWFAAKLIPPFVAKLVSAVVGGTAAGCGPGSGSSPG